MINHITEKDLAKPSHYYGAIKHFPKLAINVPTKGKKSKHVWSELSIKFYPWSNTYRLFSTNGFGGVFNVRGVQNVVKIYNEWIDINNKILTFNGAN